MIESLKIQNYQSHNDTELEFDKGVNVIVGASDSGKTAVLRALGWLVTNRPLGDSFRSSWGGATMVETKTSNSATSVVRMKSDGLNEYRLGKTTLKALKGEVPQEVDKILNLSNVNYQKQMDAPFILSMSSGEVARYLNQIVNLDKIDKALYEVGRRLREENTSLSFAQKNLKQTTEELERYDWIDGAEAEVCEIESIHAGIIDIENDVAALVNLLDRIEDVGVQREQIQTTLTMEPKVEEAVNLYEAIQKLENEVSWAQFALRKYSDTDTQLQVVSDTLGRAEKEFHKLMPDICPLCGRG